MSKTRRNNQNQNQPIHEGQFVPVEEEVEESEDTVTKTAPEPPVVEESKREKSIHIGGLTISFESHEARKMRKQQMKDEKAAKPKKGISIPVLVAGTIITGTAIKEGVKIITKVMDRTYGPSLPESDENLDSYSSDSIDDGIELVTEETDTQEI